MVRLRSIPHGPSRDLLASTEALRFLWSLEDRGIGVQVVAGQLAITSGESRITDDERAFLKKNGRHLVALTRYVEAVPAVPVNPAQGGRGS